MLGGVDVLGRPLAFQGLGRSRVFTSPYSWGGVFRLINYPIQGSYSNPGRTSRVSFWLYKEHPVSTSNTRFSNFILMVGSKSVLRIPCETQDSICVSASTVINHFVSIHLVICNFKFLHVHALSGTIFQRMLYILLGNYAKKT